MKALFLLLLLPAFAQAAIPLTNTAGSGAVNFLAVGRPSMLKIHGKATGPEAKLNLEGTKLSGTAEFELEKLDTGIGLRNSHMKEKYLETKTHPRAKLTLVEAMVDPAFATTLTNAGELPFKGKLQLHGQEKDVEGKYTAKEGLLNAKFQIKLTDYAIAIPSYLGVTVAETVDVDVELPLKKD
jgi:hypothetical protein